MSTILSKAEYEFSILEKSVKDPIILPFKKEILALVDAFGESGQSGGSAPFTTAAIVKAVENLCMQNPICPITGIDEEWGVSCTNDDLYQNKRLSSVFKEGKDGNPFYLDAIIFRCQDGSCITSCDIKLPSGGSISSRQFIKLPFKPKSFYIDVIDTEWHKDSVTGELTEQEGGGWWTHVVKDEKQLDEVFEYYERGLV